MLLLASAELFLKNISTNEQSNPVHAQQTIFGIRTAVICIALYFQGSLLAIPPHTQICSQPPSGVLVTCVDRHMAGSELHRAAGEWAYKVVAQYPCRKCQSSTCQVLSLLKYEMFSVKMHVVLQTN